LYHLTIPQNKDPHYVLISLSKLILQKRHGYKKIWTHESPNEKKEKKSWTHEGPRKRKDNHVHKRVKREREDHAKWSYNKSDGNN
jgi:hypothetical protein